MLFDVIAKHSAKVRLQVEQACQKAGRNSKDITILAVSKTQSAASIQAAIECGFTAFGENYLQEALAKQQELNSNFNLAHSPVSWHFIGAIQSNKAPEIAANFSWVHTLARAKEAQRLNQHRPENLGPLQVLIQVNISQEASKAGLQPDAILPLAELILAQPNLELRGLMCIPQATTSSLEQRQTFAQMRNLLAELKAELQTKGVAAEVLARLDTLSMGMSADLEAAILEGSNLVRIGSAIFGARAS